MVDYITDIIDQLKLNYYYYYYKENNCKEIIKIDFNNLTKEHLKNISSFYQKDFLINNINNNYFIGKVDNLVKKKNKVVFNIEGFIGTLYNNLEILLYNIEKKQPIHAKIKKITFNNIVYNKIDGKTIIELSESFNNGIINENFFKNSVNLTVSQINSFFNTKWKYTCQIECNIYGYININDNYILIDKEMKEYNKNLLIELINNSKNYY